MRGNLLLNQVDKIAETSQLAYADPCMSLDVPRAVVAVIWVRSSSLLGSCAPCLSPHKQRPESCTRRYTKQCPNVMRFSACFIFLPHDRIQLQPPPRAASLAWKGLQRAACWAGGKAAAVVSKPRHPHRYAGEGSQRVAHKLRSACAR